jgi:methionyl-tRNA formyltransferase
MSDASSLRLLFFGTPEFAVPALRALAASRHPVVGVISQPDRPRGRGRKLAPTPTKVEAGNHGIPVLQPQKVGEPDAIEWMRKKSPDLGCVVAFGQFIPKSVRELPPLRLINAHASLLPRHRGAAPVQAAILAGDTRTGISVMRLEKEMDAGDVCLVLDTEIGVEETAGELSVRLADLAATALLQAVDLIAAGRAEFRSQDPAAVTLAPKVGKGFGQIDWRMPREQVLRQIRAATPWPGADLALRKSGTQLRIIKAGRWDAPEPAPAPGRIRVEAGRLGVSALDGWVEVRRLQRPGGRPMSGAEYLRGASVPEDEEATSE